MPLQLQTMEVLHPAVHFSVRDDLTVKQFRKQENVNNGTHQKFFPLVHSILASILVKVLIRRIKSKKEDPKV